MAARLLLLLSLFLLLLSSLLPLLTAQARGSAAAPPSVGLVRRWRVLQATTAAGSSGSEGEAKPGRHGLMATRLAGACVHVRAAATATAERVQGRAETRYGGCSAAASGGKVRRVQDRVKAAAQG
jgi:hypothetical protein